MTTATLSQQTRTPLESLYESLSARWRPEDVAEIILEYAGEMFSPEERKRLSEVARGSLKRSVWGYTSMAMDFARPAGMERQVARAVDLFQTAYPLAGDIASKPEAIETLIATVSAEIGKTVGESDFKHHRLSAKDRKARGIDLSRRGYNKRFRLLSRMEARLARMVREYRKRSLSMMAKSALAAEVTWEDFSQDPNTACYVAYATAKRNMRSVFSGWGQESRHDKVAEMLLNRCEASRTTNWWAIAHVNPTQPILRRLSDQQAGRFLARWYTEMQEIAALLREAWDANDINRNSMVVRRGNDSTTWNLLAGSWNKARDYWIGLLHARGMSAVLDHFCPGKVLRLMAADVVWWHRSEGADLDPNTGVWASLPLPWDVIEGREACTRAMVEAACAERGLDPAESGWTGPRPVGEPVFYRPTPELVHGVQVGNPYLATVLKRWGFFSGKP